MGFSPAKFGMFVESLLSSCLGGHAGEILWILIIYLFIYLI